MPPRKGQSTSDIPDNSQPTSRKPSVASNAAEIREMRQNIKQILDMLRREERRKVSRSDSEPTPRSHSVDRRSKLALQEDILEVETEVEVRPPAANERSRRGLMRYHSLPTGDRLEVRSGIDSGVSQSSEEKMNGGKHAQSKSLFPSGYIRRGAGKTRCGLGEVNLAELNVGLLAMSVNAGVSKTARAEICRRIRQANEDARRYPFENVRGWIESVCQRIAHGSLRWEDRAEIDTLRSEVSQVGRLPTDTANGQPAGENNETDIPMSSEVKAAKPGPPCRHYNAGKCLEDEDHVTNGHRHLHICTFCIANRCVFVRHPECFCKYKPSIQKMKIRP